MQPPILNKYFLLVRTAGIVAKAVFIILFAVNTGNITAQSSENLVINNSFEKYEACPETHNPENMSHKLVPGWSYPSTAAPDYFNACSGGDAGVPNNFAGVSEANSGKAYVGAILSGTDEGRREYIQGQLIKPMLAGKKYCVSFFYRLASGSQLAVDQISVYFSNTEVITTSEEALPLVPQLNNLDGLFLDNIEGWHEICYVYDAKGGEKYFTIGNFKNVENTNYVVIDKNISNQRNKKYAYYYFDDVVIRALENCNDCPCVQHDFESAIIDTFYTGGKNPMTGKATKILNDGRIAITVIGGTPPYSVSWSNGSTGNTIKNLPAGKYNYTAKDNFNCISSGSVTFVQPEIMVDEFLEGLKSIEEGEAIVLENIFFEFNKTTLLPASYVELNKVADFIKTYNITKIEISGHTDSDGSDAYNQKLSEGRAKSVVDYLLTQGVLPTSLISIGYGESRPIDTNQTEAGKAKNRRVEFRLIKK
jgi:outer membrane protein OmpA-like peptidoglycan-associated protein